MEKPEDQLDIKKKHLLYMELWYSNQAYMQLCFIEHFSLYSLVFWQ